LYTFLTHNFGFGFVLIFHAVPTCSGHDSTERDRQHSADINCLVPLGSYRPKLCSAHGKAASPEDTIRDALQETIIDAMS
jgi:hypothetical protein